jgi:hypothetical protein
VRASSTFGAFVGEPGRSGNGGASGDRVVDGRALLFDESRLKLSAVELRDAVRLPRRTLEGLDRATRRRILGAAARPAPSSS